MKSFITNKTGVIDADQLRGRVQQLQIPLLVGAQGLCIVALIAVVPVWAILSVWVMLFMRLSGAVSRKIGETDKVF